MKVLRLVLFLSVMMLGIALFSIQNVQAEFTSQAEATLTLDAYCAVEDTGIEIRCQSGTLVDGAGLRIGAAGGAATYATILRYNVDQSWAINKARLNMTAGHGSHPWCGVPDADVTIYSATDDASQPVRVSLLESLDSNLAVPNPATNAVSEAYQHWTDEASPADGLVQYLEQERTGNGGDGVATLWIQWVQEGSQLFEDSAGAVVANTTMAECYDTASLAPPVLQLADAAQPLAVTSLGTSASDGGISPIVWVALVAVIVVMSGIALTSRKRKEAS